MQFGISPEFGKRFDFPENAEPLLDTSTGDVVYRMAVQIVDQYEHAIIQQIVAEARSAGVASVAVLNKAAILEALGKQIPQKPVRESCADRSCPRCDAYVAFDALNDDIADAPKFCKECGQALDWSEINA